MGKPFELPELKYAYAALEPIIDARTMEIHHTKHHAAYVNNLNKALESAPEWFDHPIEEILRRINEIPESIRTAVRNHGGGHANHSLFWEVMTPGGAKEPHGALAEAINTTFGSFAAFQEQFSNAAITRFGSGWAWLVVDGDKKLRVYSTPNQDSPYMEGHTPILGLDVWEHAYYLNYQWRRPDYVKAWWAVVNWDVVGRLYEQAR
ncbi:superoxide dismutase [Thermanaerothrix sp.]|jgi:Fe-Mn family superoxide dismutase|uniref:superoxide dismutase n=1 Tax=Thermanaerothrix sp. TaxID=2972675 RepID=UPI002ADD583C|nr:superoxide dismutase [Thermanaerothrix sp.]